MFISRPLCPLPVCDSGVNHTVLMFMMFWCGDVRIAESAIMAGPWLYHMVHGIARIAMFRLWPCCYRLDCPAAMSHQAFPINNVHMYTALTPLCLRAGHFHRIPKFCEFCRYKQNESYIHMVGLRPLFWPQFLLVLHAVHQQSCVTETIMDISIETIMDLSVTVPTCQVIDRWRIFMPI